MGNWLPATLPYTGGEVAVDIVPGPAGPVAVEAMKIDIGGQGDSIGVSEGHGLPFVNDGIMDLDLGHYLEPLQNTDAANAGALFVSIKNSPTISSGTLTTVSSVTNIAAIAGAGAELFTNWAEAAYNTQISQALVFS